MCQVGCFMRTPDKKKTKPLEFDGQVGRVIRSRSTAINQQIFFILPRIFRKGIKNDFCVTIKHSTFENHYVFA